MVSEQVRNAVWQDMLDVARVIRYYDALSDRYKHNQAVIRFLLLIAVAGGIGALLDLFPEIAQLISGGLVALLVAWDFISDYARKAAILHVISIECSALEIEWQSLWFKIETLDDDTALNENTRLLRRISDVTGWAGQANIREDRKLNEECERVAYEVMEARYTT